MMDNRQDQAPAPVLLRDYQPPAYLIDHVELRFELGTPVTRVTSRLTVRRNPEATGQDVLFLNGEDLVLGAVRLDGRTLDAADYALNEEGLTIRAVPAACVLEIETEIRPADNTELSGLYQSSGNFCTQCEAEGFRRITFFPDRPDVLARYTTTVIADPALCPVLLSNGNPIDQGNLDDGRHWMTWEDPYPKPSYLFALVAGDLAWIEDSFTTASGREVELHIYVQAHNIDKCEHAMVSLKNAMRWDEAVYGREYDLDRYMIVAVDDFNMGAMENKGLNVFNSKFVLARPETATDVDYQHIEGVIGHEYFHNWSGNRVTCRDWFQLSLKEGFTVFRDQEFSSDMGSRGVKRIQDVNLLRTHQFREDAGPMAHPVRPDSYIEINNFYTATVYNKGAEVVRMLHTLLGADDFRRGTDLYFARHDGQAVTTEDFVRALEDASGRTFQQFRRWYSQSGTPVISIQRAYDPNARSYALTISQDCPATPGQPQKDPFHIPLALALLNAQGQALPLRLYDEAAPGGVERVLELCEREETVVFQDIAAEPVPSLLRGFSAPVRLEIDYSQEELAFLLANDTDPFARWEAGQRLARGVIFTVLDAQRAGETPVMPEGFVRAFRRLLDEQGDDAFLAECLTLPSENYLSEFMETVDPVGLHEARQWVRRTLASQLRDAFQAGYENRAGDAYRLSAADIGRRALRNLCLQYLIGLETPEVYALAIEQYHRADNMTDRLAALAALVNSQSPEREQWLEDFYVTWQNEPLVVDKWLTLQATAQHPDTLDHVMALVEHPAFSLNNPNKVYSLLRAFGSANPAQFHAADGRGYRFLGEQLKRLDAINPQVAARVVSAFTSWRRYDTERQTAMKAVLEDLLSVSSLSKDLVEIISKTLS